MSYAPGTEPHGRSYEEEALHRSIRATQSIPTVNRTMLETDRVNAEPGTPKLPREAPHVEVPISIVESAEAFVSPKPDGEAESETEFGEKLQAAARKANAETIWR